MGKLVCFYSIGVICLLSYGAPVQILLASQAEEPQTTHPVKYIYAPYLALSGSKYQNITNNSISLHLDGFSLATWFRTDKNYSSPAFDIINGGGISDTKGINMSYGIGITKSGKIQAGYETRSDLNCYAISPGSYNDGKWHYIVLTNNNSYVRLFIDGLLVARGSACGTVPDGKGTVSIKLGSNPASANGFFTALIDEIRVWKRAVTPQEVSEAYNNGIFNTNGQVLYLAFGDSMVGTFYYPWWRGKQEGYRGWSVDDHNPPKSWRSMYLPDTVPGEFDPANELYSVVDSSTIKKQLGWMKEAGIEFAIASWFGPSTGSDDAFRNIIHTVMPDSDNPYPTLMWTILYEDEGSSNPGVHALIDDLNYIKSNYAFLPQYLRLDGKPVIFVYNAVRSGQDPLDDLERWSQAREKTGFYVVMKADQIMEAGADPRSMDGWYRYSPGLRFDQVENFSASVSPGYWNYHDDRATLARDPVEFEHAVAKLASADVYFKLILTWNEWKEGTGVEPAQQIVHDDTRGFSAAAESYADTYIDILGTYLGSAVHRR
jgi:hypothetical protein